MLNDHERLTALQAVSRELIRTRAMRSGKIRALWMVTVPTRTEPVRPSRGRRAPRDSGDDFGLPGGTARKGGAK